MDSTMLRVKVDRADPVELHEQVAAEIRLLPTAANRQPALAAYSRGADDKHRPYGLMVFEIDGGQISGIFGFPDPWLFEQCGLPPELNYA